MWCDDFEFDGELASDYGVMVANFDSGGGIVTNQNGADIEFSTIKTPGDNEWKYINSQYKEVLAATIQISKKNCDNENNPYFSVNEQRVINRWLNRNDGFHKLKLIKKDYNDIYFEAQINVKKIELYDKVIGFELTITTNKPYANFEAKTFDFSVAQNGTYTIKDISDEIGSQYPYVEIMVSDNGNLKIENSQHKNSLNINKCVSGEKITIDNKNHILSSSVRGTEIMDDFNFVWLKIGNTLTNKDNVLSFSLPCSVVLTYIPVCKVGL